MAECEFYRSCPCITGPAGDFLKKMWFYQYCNGPKLSLCAVREAMMRGSVVSDDMMPNGERMI